MPAIATIITTKTKRIFYTFIKQQALNLRGDTNNPKPFSLSAFSSSFFLHLTRPTRCKQTYLNCIYSFFSFPGSLGSIGSPFVNKLR